MRKIAIVGFKGGIGKTTTCVSLGAGLALKGRRVLLVDTDTQSNVSLSLGIGGYSRSLADVLTRRARAEDCVLAARKNLDLLPSSVDLFKAQQRLVLEMAREEAFVELLGGLFGYDYILLDCAPSLSLLTVNAIAYVDEIFVPVSMEMLALAGLRQFMTYLREITRMLGRGAVVRLIVPTFYDPRRRVSSQVVRALAEEFPAAVALPIRLDTRLSEAPGAGQTIFEYAHHSRGAQDYARLVERVDRMPVPEPEPETVFALA
jgi:chromosome partitioning protein